MEGRALLLEARFDIASVRGSTNTSAVSSSTAGREQSSSSSSLSSDVSRSSIALGCDWILSKNAVGEAGAGAE